jgi:hypothetical protein
LRKSTTLSNELAAKGGAFIARDLVEFEFWLWGAIETSVFKSCIGLGARSILPADHSFCHLKTLVATKDQTPRTFYSLRFVWFSGNFVPWIGR